MEVDESKRPMLPILFAVFLYAVHGTESVLTELLRMAEVPNPEVPVQSLSGILELSVVVFVFALVCIVPIAWGSWNLLFTRIFGVRRAGFVDAVGLTVFWLTFTLLASWNS